MRLYSNFRNRRALMRFMQDVIGHLELGPRNLTVPTFTAERFSLSVRYNCRFDVDNSIICIKFLADYLRNNDYVVDDTPKYFMKQSTAFDPSLEKNQFVATIKCHGFQRTE